MIRIANFADHRTTRMLAQARALEQEAADLRVEAEWRRRIAENIRRRNARKVDAIAREILSSNYLSST